MLENNENSNSLSIIQNQMKENTKIIKQIVKIALTYKKKEYEDLKKEINNILKNSKLNIENIKNNSNETLLHILGKEGKLEPIKLIVENYIEILGINETFFNWFCLENNEHLSILEIVCEKDNIKLINYIYEIISKTTEDRFRLKEKRNNIFHLAAKGNNSYAVIFFYEKLQNYFKEQLIFDFTNQYDVTPLHYACYYGSKEVIDLLLDLGANIKAVDSDGNTCLHYAVKSESVRAVKKLLVRGANKNAKNKEGKTPFDVALDLKKDELYDILKNFTFKDRCFSKIDEIKPIKGGRNNILLLLTVIFLLLFKFCFMIRIMGYKIGKNQMFFFPLMSDLISGNFRNFYYDNVYSKTETDPNYTNFFDYYYENLSQLYSVKINDCFEGGIMQKYGENILGYGNLITILIDFCLLIIIIHFICFSKDIFEKKRIKHREPLSKLFDNGMHVCVKCRIPKKKGTVHCIVCNACCSEFDHHCFWLNRCISKKNIKSFKLFLILLFLFCIGNIYFSITNLISVVLSDENYVNENENIKCKVLHMKIIRSTCEFMKKNEYRTIFRNALFFLIFVCLGLYSIYCLLFLVFPVIKFTFFKKNKKSLITEFETSLIDQSQINSLYDVTNISNI